MDRDELRALRDSAPDDYDARLVHFSPCGQLAGWMSQPDARWLVEWLPGAAKVYPTHPMRIVEVGTFAGSTARGLITLSGGGQAKCIDDFTDMNPGTLAGHPNGRSYWEMVLRSNGVDLLPFATLIEGKSTEIGAGWN